MKLNIKKSERTAKIVTLKERENILIAAIQGHRYYQSTYNDAVSAQQIKVDKELAELKRIQDRQANSVEKLASLESGLEEVRKELSLLTNKDVKRILSLREGLKRLTHELALEGIKIE